jgi:hypothetical protein
VRIWYNSQECVEVPDVLYYSQKLYFSKLNPHFRWGFLVAEGMLHAQFLTPEDAKIRMAQFLAVDGLLWTD